MGAADTTDATGLTGLQNYPLVRRGVLMTGLISGFTLATEYYARIGDLSKMTDVK